MPIGTLPVHFTMYVVTFLALYENLRFDIQNIPSDEQEIYFYL